VRAFEYWGWRRLLRVPWTAKRSNASVGAEVGGGISLEVRALKLQLSYFGHVIRADGLEKDFMLGMGNGTRSRGRQDADGSMRSLKRQTLISRV